MKNKSEVFFLSHGGGPLPLLGDSGHQEMVACLQKISNDITKPSAIVMVSAHWEGSVATITSGAQPSLIYDYSGFPEESYHIKYPCLGEPLLAQKIFNLFKDNHINAKLDENRGFDHGLFVPLKIMYPQADIPCVQLSLLSNLDPSLHIQMGKVLQNLSYNNVLVIGSGFSFHNMKAFFSPDTSETKAMNENFDQWLIETLTKKDIDEDERTNRLVHWEKAPYARYAHPREEHLLPLHVCYGLANRSSSKHYELKILNKKSSMYYWAAE